MKFILKYSKPLHKQSPRIVALNDESPTPPFPSQHLRCSWLNEDRTTMQQSGIYSQQEVQHFDYARLECWINGPFDDIFAFYLNSSIQYVSWHFFKMFFAYSVHFQATCIELCEIRQLDLSCLRWCQMRLCGRLYRCFSALLMLYM